MAGKLIVEHLDGETLVYDTASDEAHCLDPVAAAEFEAAPDDVSRRQALRKLAIVGAAAVGGTPLIKTIVAPTPAHAASVPTMCGTGTCTAGQTCCDPTGAGSCCTTGQCCTTAVSHFCDPLCGMAASACMITGGTCS